MISFRVELGCGSFATRRQSMRLFTFALLAKKGNYPVNYRNQKKGVNRMSVQLLEGNCVDIMKTLPQGLVDLTVTSPPYDGLRTYKGYSFDFESVAQELYRITKDGGVVVWI